MTEADYLRGELIRAKGLLAEACGLLKAAGTLAPDFGALPVVTNWQAEWDSFKVRGVAVLPKGVK